MKQIPNAQLLLRLGILISVRTNTNPIIVAITSGISGAHNIATMLLVIVAMIIEAGTNIIISRSNASTVDLTLLPIDCKIIAADFM